MTAEIPNDLALVEAKLNGKRWKADLADAVISATMRRTIEGASEVRMDLVDTTGAILRSGIFGADSVFEFDGLKFALVKPAKNTGSRLSMTFEDAEVAKLRKFRKPRRVYRDKVTRAQFAAMLVREAKTIKFRTLGKARPIKNTNVVDSADAPGFAPNVSGITVKGKAATKEQIANMAKVLAVCVQRKVPRKIQIAAIATIIVESNARNLAGGDRDSEGLFQQRPSQGWGTSKQVRTPSYATGKFLDRAMPIYRATPNKAIGEICQGVQRSAFPNEYAKRVGEATTAVDKYSGGGAANPNATADQNVTVLRYAFTRGAPGGPYGENSWQALQRLATEVGWRCFMRRGTVWFGSEYDLFRIKPVATVTPTSQGVDEVTFENDIGAKVAEAKIQARVSRWLAQPGSVIALEGYGLADGRWLVVETERSLFSRNTTITVRKPIAKLPEPAPETRQIVTAVSEASVGDFDTVTLDTNPNGAGSAPEKIMKAYLKASQISDARIPYAYGGGHGSTFKPTTVRMAGRIVTGYDCSGAVSAVLGAIGELSSPQSTIGLASFGAAGEGVYLTLWVRNGSKAVAHTFLEFKVPGKTGHHFGTGRYGESFGGAGFKRNMHPKANFTPRHIPGM